MLTIRCVLLAVVLTTSAAAQSSSPLDHVEPVLPEPPKPSRHFSFFVTGTEAAGQYLGYGGGLMVHNDAAGLGIFFAYTYAGMGANLWHDLHGVSRERRGDFGFVSTALMYVPHPLLSGYLGWTIGGGFEKNTGETIIGGIGGLHVHLLRTLSLGVGLNYTHRFDSDRDDRVSRYEDALFVEVQAAVNVHSW